MEFCHKSARIWQIVGYIIMVVKIVIPLIIIILGIIDLGKAVISSKEDEVKKAKKSLINRLIYAVLVFCVVWIVTIVMDAISGIGIEGTNTTNWKTCWEQIRGK